MYYYYYIIIIIIIIIIIHKHVYNFLQYNNIITQSQSGFIPGDSTVNQLLCIYNDSFSSFDKGITMQAVYLDISKAFDRVWHTGLLSKLEVVCIRGKLLNWFQDYLSCCMQATVIKGEKSNFKCFSRSPTRLCLDLFCSWFILMTLLTILSPWPSYLQTTLVCPWHWTTLTCVLKYWTMTYKKLMNGPKNWKVDLMKKKLNN